MCPSGIISRVPERADGLRRRHDRLRLSEFGAHRPAAGLVPERAMLQLAILADDGALAIGLDLVGAEALDDRL